MKSSLVAHPILFAILPIVSLLAHNIDGIAVGQTVRPMLIAVTGALLLWLLLGTFLKNWRQAGLVCSVVLLLFFSYGHVFTGFVHPATGNLFVKTGLVGRHEPLLLTWIALGFIAVFAILRLKTWLQELTTLLNLVSVIALAMPLYSIVAYEVQLQRPWLRETQPAASSGIGTPEQADYPDIYYIVLDGHARMVR